MSAWRDRPNPTRKCPTCRTDWPTERFELVERLIAAEKRCRILEARCRELDTAEMDTTTALAVRVLELEETVQKLNAKIVQQNDKQRRPA